MKNAASFSWGIVKAFSFFYSAQSLFPYLVTFNEGTSMHPIISADGANILFATRFNSMSAYKRRKVGDVIWLQHPYSSHVLLCKRLKGKAGDVVEYVDDRPNGDGTRKKIVVPEGHMWVQGDNTLTSIDSR